ncbi:MAG: OmpA family protein [Planctomycetota bacterium]|nr:MAG: OmpA family protein [Planctomycetota bacterium]
MPRRSPTTTPNAQDELERLRELILGNAAPERIQKELDRLRARLDDQGIRAEEISRALPAAIRRSTARDEQLSQALGQTIEGALDASVRRNPKPIAEAIFPIIGPAIRKAIANAIRGMVQGINQTLEHSLTPRGLRWRWESWRTGVPFAQIVLLKSLVYRVEQVFLIHRETSLLLHHVAADDVRLGHPEAVPAMVSVIQDFVGDSFSEAGGLQQFEVGEVSVLTEHGPEAYLAVVVRGIPPASHLRERMNRALERVHLEFGAQLGNFQGDSDPFADTETHLESCLVEEKRSQKPNWVSASMLILALLLFSIWLTVVLVRDFQMKRRWNGFLDHLGTEPGITVVESGRRNGNFFVHGLKDPFAADPQALAGQHLLRPQNIQWQWEAYHALTPTLVERRAAALLEAPDEVRLQVLEQGLLQVEGRANHAWIRRLDLQAPLIPGIRKVNRTALQDTDAMALEQAAQDLESYTWMFPPQASAFADLSSDAQNRWLEGMERLHRAAVRMGLSMEGQVRIDRQANESESLATERWQNLLAALPANLRRNSAWDPVFLTEGSPSLQFRLAWPNRHSQD